MIENMGLLIVVLAVAVVWITYDFAYDRGYKQGYRDGRLSKQLTHTNGYDDGSYGK